jgi:DNA topoisomerase-3
LVIYVLLKEPNDYKPIGKVGFEQLTYASDKFETKVVENSGIQKQFRIIKVYLTKLIVNCGMIGEGDSTLMNEANYKGEATTMDFLNPEAIERVCQTTKI